MFFKFIKHDLRTGIWGQKARMLVTFSMFFCLSSYYFLTVRIFELTDPQYFETPVTTGDYFLSIIGGCGKVVFFDGMDNSFVMPTIWMVFVLWMQFVSLYYPFSDLNGMGKQLIVISGKRSIWWLSKCIWTVVNTSVNYLLIFASSLLSGLCFGAKPSMQAHWYLARILDIRIDDLTTQTTWNLWPLFLLTGFILIAFSLLQLFLSLAVTPLFSYFLLAAYLFAGAYIQSPAFLGNFLMAARNSRLVVTGLPSFVGIVPGIVITAISIAAGLFLFRRKDILGAD